MSHTFHEDEQRRRHFEEWDRVLDDHLDTVHVLQAGVDPYLDWVWDDTEYMHPVLAFIHLLRDEFLRSTREFIKKVGPEIRKAWDRIADAARSAVSWVTETVGEWHEWSDHRAKSLAPLAPPRVDTRRVTHTRTKPPKPVLPYRRRTP